MSSIVIMIGILYSVLKFFKISKLISPINSNNISVSVMARDNSANKCHYLVKDALIVPGAATVLVGGEQKIVLEAGDFLSVTSSLAASADVIVSVLEIS